MKHCMWIPLYAYLYAEILRVKGLMSYRASVYMNKMQIDKLELLCCVKAMLLPFSATVSSSGELYTWGRGNYGRLGHGCSEDHNVPTLVADLKGTFSDSSNCITLEVFIVLKIYIVVFWIMTACSVCVCVCARARARACGGGEVRTHEVTIIVQILIFGNCAICFQVFKYKVQQLCCLKSWP
jgi:hypothetical protein